MDLRTGLNGPAQLKNKNYISRKFGNNVKQGKEITKMAVLLFTPSSTSISCSTTSVNCKNDPIFNARFPNSCGFAIARRPITALHVCTPPHHPGFISVDKASLIVDETTSDDQLWAAACLRVRCFYEFEPNTFAVQVSCWIYFINFFSFFVVERWKEKSSTQLLFYKKKGQAKWS